MKLKTSVFMLLLVASFTANANSYFDIDSKVKKKKETLTDAQFNEYLLTLKGIEVNWRGKVLDVEKDFFGSNYTIRLDVDGDGSTDVWFEDLQKKRALTLSKGKTYDVSGEIKSVSVTFGTVYIRMRSKLESAEDQKRRDNKFLIVDIPRIAGKAESEVSAYLGKAELCSKSKYGRKCQYEMGETEIVYIQGKADWITVSDMGSTPFSKVALRALGLKQVRPSFSNNHVLRWNSTQGLREISLFPRGRLFSDYAYIKVKTK